LLFIRYLPGWIVLFLVGIILLPNMTRVTLNTAGRLISQAPNWIGGLLAGPSPIAPFFTPQVRYWAEDIERWAKAYELDPDLLATVMQIESCGHPSISSHAGAQGLFQVMPFHFEAGESTIDPETNAKRGTKYLKFCVDYTGGDVGLALACYNGGPSVTKLPATQWKEETRKYYYWGTGIYDAALNNEVSSARLTQWLEAGGQGLCERAAGALGM
jgi:soluble lytic murein transglycosylase-like protein